MTDAAHVRCDSLRGSPGWTNAPDIQFVREPALDKVNECPVGRPQRKVAVEPGGRSEDGPILRSRRAVGDEEGVSGSGRVIRELGAVVRPVELGHDPDCKPHVYKTGMGFVDAGGDHVHILRNEGDVEAKTIAVQIIPADAARRIDVEDPGNCHF